MKKMSLILLAVVLLLAALAGGAYVDSDHQPVKGNKLIGVGQLGTHEGIPYIEMWTHFGFTNPDCVEEITITKVSIIEENGDLVYEGPYISVTRNGLTREVKTDPMNPHEIWGINLEVYMWTGLGDYPENLTDPANWLTFGEAMAQPIKSYTVEIEWEAKGGVCPLTGWKTTKRIDWVDGLGGNMYQSQMVNMKQKKHKKDK